MKRIVPVIAISVGIGATFVGACKKPSPTASVDAAAPFGIPMASASVQSFTNPENLPIYDGPVGSVEGVIRVKGDAPPEQDVRVTPECAPFVAKSRKLFREGPGRTLADVLVAVTEFPGYVPAQGEAVRVSIRNCEYDRRTVSVTFGQRIEVDSQDESRQYIPSLRGGTATALRVVVAGQDPVSLHPMKVGLYGLEDQMNRPWMKSRVYVLKYATHTVTGLDGRFRISGIPVGKTKLNAFLPDADLVDNRELVIQDGKTAHVDIEFTYKKPSAAASASASASAQP